MQSMALQVLVATWVNKRSEQRVVPSAVLDILSLRYSIVTLASISYGLYFYFPLCRRGPSSDYTKNELIDAPASFDYLTHSPLDANEHTKLSAIRPAPASQ